MEMALEFDGVTKRYAGTEVLSGIDLAVAPGEFVTVVGPSGCGKTTLLRLAAGLDRPTAGRVRRRAGGGVGYVFQDATLLPWRSVRGNVELPGELRRLPRAERRARAERALELVGLGGFAGSRPRTLSVGMRMRVSLARALVLDPALFLFDEPFAALDEITRERLAGELLALHAARGFGAVFVTHSVLEAVYLGSRVVVLSDRPARVVAQVPVPLAHPRTPDQRYSTELARVAAAVSAHLRGRAAPSEVCR